MMIYYLRKYSAFLFPLQMPRIAAGRFCLWGGGFADGPLYKSHLYRKLPQDYISLYKSR